MDPLFQVHRLNDAGQEKAGRIAKAFDELMTVLRETVGDGLTLTENHLKYRSFGMMSMHLEEACMHAKKALALDPQNQRWNKRQQTPSPQINADER